MRMTTRYVLGLFALCMVAPVNSFADEISLNTEDSSEQSVNKSREHLRKLDEHNKQLRALKKRQSEERKAAREKAKRYRDEYRDACGLGSRNTADPKCSELKKVTLELERETSRYMNRRHAKERKALRSQNLR